MANNFLESKNVKVFPSAYRGKKTSNSVLYNPEARLNSEFNFATLSTSGKQKSYVISSTCVDNKWEIELNIKGYWFKIYNLSINALEGVSTASYIYVHTEVENRGSTWSEGTEYEATSLVAQNYVSNEDASANTRVEQLDTADFFYGLNLITSATELSTGVDLLLFKKTDSTWDIPADSKFSMNQDLIKGGIVDKPTYHNLSTDTYVGDHSNKSSKEVFDTKHLYTGNIHLYGQKNSTADFEDYISIAAPEGPTEENDLCAVIADKCAIKIDKGFTTIGDEHYCVFNLSSSALSSYTPFDFRYGDVSRFKMDKDGNLIGTGISLKINNGDVTTETLYLEGQKADNFALKIASDGKVTSESFENTTAAATALNSATLEYVDKIVTNAAGKITTNTSKKAVFATGAAQGYFKIGEQGVLVKDLDQNSSPSFISIYGNHYETDSAGSDLKINCYSYKGSYVSQTTFKTGYSANYSYTPTFNITNYKGSSESATLNIGQNCAGGYLQIYNKDGDITTKITRDGILTLANGGDYAHSITLGGVEKTAGYGAITLYGSKDDSTNEIKFKVNSNGDISGTHLALTGENIADEAIELPATITGSTTSIEHGSHPFSKWTDFLNTYRISDDAEGGSIEVQITHWDFNNMIIIGLKSVENIPQYHYVRFDPVDTSQFPWLEEASFTTISFTATQAYGSTLAVCPKAPVTRVTYRLVSGEAHTVYEILNYNSDSTSSSLYTEAFDALIIIHYGEK